MAAPPISICLPVYNGQQFLADAINSHLAQTCGDFELIISDNASTDATQEICHEFASKDKRIIYVRNLINLGCAPNFNRAYEFVRGQYIRWAAHDDLVAPTHLAECLAALRSDPSLVLAQTQVRVIAEKGEGGRMKAEDSSFIPHPSSLHSAALHDPPRTLDHADPSVRFEELLLRTLWCFEIFGLMRKEFVDRTPLHGSFYGSDKVLLAYLILMGRFVEIPQPLFLRRAHAGSSMHFKTDEEREAWIATTKKRSRLMTPRVNCFLGYCDAVKRAELPMEDKLNCGLVIGKWLMQWKKLLRLMNLESRNLNHEDTKTRRSFCVHPCSSVVPAADQTVTGRAERKEHRSPGASSCLRGFVVQTHGGVHGH